MTHSDIQKRAYELWELRGKPTGTAEDDFYRAERILEAEEFIKKEEDRILQLKEINK